MSLQTKRRNHALNATGATWSCVVPRSIGAAGLVLCAFLGAPDKAEAKPARCFTSDGGFYDCDRAGDPQGGFTISAPGKKTVILQIEQPKNVPKSEKKKAEQCVKANQPNPSKGPVIAFGFTKFEDRYVPQAGFYCRDPADRACWDNDNGVTRVRVCAWSRP